ncbi:MAG TPA: NADPH:quinone reductase [Mycobacteriales bacterium]|jgi:NADPH:quinone reductase-like Zn-dependent oxidoreductase|nr:NADPH:quinone reductase [Mycobacteriales bacterium]
MAELPEYMWAAFIQRPGAAESIVFGELPLPSPGPTDVLVRVSAVGVNHVDTFIRSGAYRTRLPRPFVVGRDAVGEVVSCGRGVTGFVEGDTVWTNSLGHDGRQGAAAQYAVVSAGRLYSAPKGRDPVEIAAVVHPAATAYLALFRHAHLHAGETIYIAGGGGGVGSALIELASAAGARVLASARPADHARCRACGAEEVFDYRSDDLLGRLREYAPKGVDVYIDTSGRNDLPTAVGLLAYGGRVVLLAGMSSRSELPVGPLYVKDASVLGFAISNAAVTDLAVAADRINSLLASGALASTSLERLELRDAALAHRRLESGEVHGGTRLVLEPPL